jgi:hypothetical protein
MSTEIMKLKSWPAFFKALNDQSKTHDIRNTRDRDFYVGQPIIIQEYNPFTGQYTGSELEVEVTYITSHHTPCAVSSAVLDRDFSVLSLKLIKRASKPNLISASMLAGEAFLEAFASSENPH